MVDIESVSTNMSRSVGDAQFMFPGTASSISGMTYIVMYMECQWSYVELVWRGYCSTSVLPD